MYASLKKFFLAFFLTVFFFMAIDLAMVAFFIPVDKLRTHYPHASFDGEQMRFIIKESRPTRWTPLSHISPFLIKSIILSEDGNFYRHHGLDLEELQKALQQSWKKKKWGRGASTITQQLVKNIYLSPKKSLWRKVKEAILALRVERVLSKQRILELYLNVIEVRPHTAGVSEGAQYFFKKSPASLRPKEAAFLAMLLPNPEKYSISFQRKQLTTFARKRTAHILRQMAQVGTLSWGTSLSESALPLSFEKVKRVAPPPIIKPTPELEEEDIDSLEEEESSDLPTEEPSS